MADLRLGRDEELLWSGRPRDGLRLQASDLFVIPFSIFWAGFSVLWFLLVLASGATAFAFFGVPFLVIGAYITVGRFFWDRAQRRRTTYALTDTRLLIVQEQRSGTKHTALDLRLLGEIQLRTKADGSGTITFGSPTAVPGFGRVNLPSGWPMAGGAQAPMFDHIDDAGSVERRIRDAQAAVLDRS